MFIELRLICHASRVFGQAFLQSINRLGHLLNINTNKLLVLASHVYFILTVLDLVFQYFSKS